MAGVQEGVWPDLRLRGSLLGSERLVDVVAGRGQSTFRAAQAAVRYDETRLFLVAVTRASERLLVTAVRSDDEQPSVYLDVVDPPERATPPTSCARSPTSPAAMTLPALVGELRREAGHPRLAGRARGRGRTAWPGSPREGVPGADPAQWWALRERHRRPPAARREQARAGVALDRSTRFGDCGLRWLLARAVARARRVGAAAIGTLVHDIAAELGDVDADTLRRRGRRPLGPARAAGRLGLRPQRHEAHGDGHPAGAATSSRPRGGVGAASAPSSTCRSRSAGRSLAAGSTGSSATPTARSGWSTSRPGEQAARRPRCGRHGQLGAYQVAVEHGAFAEHGSRSAGAALLQVGKAAGAKTTLQVQQPLDARRRAAAGPTSSSPSTAEGMAGLRFLATVGPACPTRRTCR